MKDGTAEGAENMARIRALDEQMIGKIAAGEVVERPAAAIKELVENSLDAGADSVQVEIHQDSTEYFRVADNGSGIDPSDMKLAFERHATSKISTEKDLFNIATLGFRGEALASIAAVSKVTLTTRTPKQESGIKVQNEGGQMLAFSEAACPAGTTVVVRDRFFNTPVRKKFLKRPAAELAQVTDLIAHFILSRPDVAFRLTCEGKSIYHSSGNGELSDALITVYGASAFRQMRKIQGHQNGVILDGYIGIGELARSSRNAENFFINHRIMKSTVLSAALENACRERVMIGKYPMCAIHLQTAYDAVDVNIHPNKLEVRFRDEAGIRQAVYDLAAEAVRDEHPFEKPVSLFETPVNSGRQIFQNEKKQTENTQSPANSQPAEISYIQQAQASANRSVVTMSSTMPEDDHFSIRSEKPRPVLRESIAPANPALLHTEEKTDATDPVETAHPKGPASDEKLLQLKADLPPQEEKMIVFGAGFNTYILIEYQDSLYLADQHAIHERLLFDRMLKDLDGADAASQELMIPRIVSLTQKEQIILEENRAMLEKIGLRAEPFGPGEVAIRAVPMLLGEPAAADFVRELVSERDNGCLPTEEKKRSIILHSA